MNQLHRLKTSRRTWLKSHKVPAAFLLFSLALFMLASLVILSTSVIGVGWWIGQQINVDADMVNPISGETVLIGDSLTEPYDMAEQAPKVAMAVEASPAPTKASSASAKAAATPTKASVASAKTAATPTKASVASAKTAATPTKASVASAKTAATPTKASVASAKPTPGRGTRSLAAVGVLNNPPAGGFSVVVFPQRDFVHADGYAINDLVVVRVIHDPAIFGVRPVVTTGELQANWISPQSTDPALPAGADGIVEVNHPGGSCWLGATPDIRPGDRVQFEVMSGTNVGRIDELTVSNVTAKRPTTVGTNLVVHGTAQDALGNPLPIAQIEHRIIAPGAAFAVNSRRGLRATAAAGSDGVLAYDPISLTNPKGINWTATYSGLVFTDITLALGAESRGIDLGTAIAPSVGSTIYEIGALTVAGPAAPCTAPLEVLPPPPGSELVPPTNPTNLIGTTNGVNTVTLNWTASTDNVGVTAYGIYRNDIAIFTVSNPDGSAPAPTTFVESNLTPGAYTFQVRAFDEVGNASGLSNIAGPFTAIAQVDVNTFPVNDPPALPINIIAFPSRDFISPSGYNANDTVTVQVLRKNAAGQFIVVSSADGIIPIDGFAEVNHPGGSCWQGVTPDMRVGDIVRTIAYNPANITLANPAGIRSIDQTHIAGVTAYKPVVVTPASLGLSDGVVEIHGTALGANGLPLPLGEIEQRMIATHGVGLWDFNGRRAMRAAANSDGTLTYDTVNNPMGVKWTARYSGLDAADITRMGAADTRMHWLGRDPVALNEATIFENSDGNPPGPAGPGCTRPLEAADVLAPTAPGVPAAGGLFQSSANQVTLNWTASTDDWYVAGYRIYLDGVAIANTGPLATSYALSVAPGAHTYAVSAFDTASPRGLGATIIDQIIAGFGKLYGNLSAQTSLGTLNQLDVTAPSVPTNLVAQSGAGSANLTWSASSDNVGVASYNVYRNGGTTAIATVNSPATSYNDTGLAAGTYTYTVDAVDAAGNRSAKSAAATANVTAVADVTLPTVPTNVAAVTSPDIHGRNVVVSWTASTDNVGVTGYGIYRGGSLIASVNGATLSYTNANLATGTFNYTVDAFDSAGNRSVQSAASTAVVANDPPVAPHSLIAFPARDFLSGTGFTPGASYHFTLIRGGQTYLSASFLANATGTIEVNHPGGTCWNVNTPDIRAGDVVRITNDATGIADQTTVPNVTADRPIAINANTVVIHGTAKDALGQPLPVGQIEQRLISSTASSFDFNGRRILRTGGDGTLAYDAPGSTNWTATYTGLSANDVLRAVGGTSPTGTVFVGAESRAHWLGRDPLALTEATIFENGPAVVGGPSAPCTAPAETPVAGASFTPASISFANIQFLPAPVQTSAASTVTFSNGGGAPMTITNIYFAGLNPGDFARSGGTCPNPSGTLAAGATCTVTVTFKPTALGLRQANLSFSGNSANTTDLTVSLTGIGVDNTNPTISVSPTSKNFGTVNGGASASQIFTVTNSSADLTGRSLTITAATIEGTNAADFTITANACIGVALASANPPTAAGSCTVTVQFKPGARTARSATLVLTHNAAPAATSTSIALSGTGGNGSVLSFASNLVNFGSVAVNKTKDQTISVKNSGNAAATLNLASFTTTGAQYTVLSTTCATLAVNASCNVIVRFTAPSTIGTFAGTLLVTAANGLPSVVTTNLTATTAGGAPPPPPPPGTSVLSFNANPVQFGTVNVNTTKDQSISVKNSGTAAATLNLASFTTTGAQYTVLSTTCATLAAGGSCNVIVRFTAPSTVATFTGTLSVTAANASPTTATTNLTATTK